MNTEAHVAEIVGRCRERLERGEPVDLDAVIRQHASVAEPLRRRFEALRLLDRTFARGEAAEHAAAPPLAGRLVGVYRLESMLGAGGMGTVYLAKVEGRAAGLEAGSRVAVKVIHPHLLERTGFFRRFLREAEIGRRLRHENVVRTLDADAIDADGERLHFFVMEYVEGQTLRELLNELRRVPEELCRHIGIEVANALAAIHEAGAVHRDLKPENVLITRDNGIKVMDLGVAWLQDETIQLSQTGAFVGSVQYAAPEQFGGKGKGIDGRADLYSLGLTLYELATGQHPFASEDFHAVLSRQLGEVPRPAGAVNPQLSPFFEEVLVALLEKDRSRRIASAVELARILEEGERSAWWRSRATALRVEAKRALRRIRIPRETAVVGREEELERLRALYERAGSGEGNVVLVEGEAGIGKSRLVDEFVGRLRAAGEDVNFLFGSYPPGGAATVSGAFSAAYREHFGAEGLDAMLGPYLGLSPVLAPAFAALLRGEGTPEGAEPLTKDSLQTCFVHVTRALAAERTTIVLADDLHFAPEEGRALFTSLALAVPGHRILLVGTSRPTRDGQWTAALERTGHVARLQLGRLGPKDLVLLLGQTFRSVALAEELAGKIAVKSDGNPYFVFEIVRGLKEGQFLAQKPDGTWATTQVIRDIQIPSSVLELVQARVADLGEDERNILDIASCLGFEFDPLVVGDVLGMARIPLLRRLGQIERAHRLVRAAGRRYVFDHHQVQEALYGSLSELLRAEYHAAIGDAVEARTGGAAREPSALDGALCVDLAEHFLKGGMGERALHYLGSALTHLEGGFLNDAAVRLAGRALAVPGLVGGRERVETLLRTAKSLDLLGRSEAERAVLEEAMVIADADPDLRERALLALGTCLGDMSRTDEAIARLGEAQDLARAVGDRELEGRATGTRGTVLRHLGRVGEAREHHERQLDLAREIGDRNGETAALANLATDLGILGRFPEARLHHERAVVQAFADGQRVVQAKAIANFGVHYMTIGRLGEAVKLLDRALTCAREIGGRRVEAVVTANLGLVYCTLGQLAKAREHGERALALAREIGSRHCQADGLAALADIAAEEGDGVTTERRYAEALVLLREIGRRGREAEMLRTRGAYFARRDRVSEAHADLESALALARELSLPFVELLAAASLALLAGGDICAVVAVLAGHEKRSGTTEAMEARFLLWQATHDSTHLAEAKRLLDHLLEHAPADCRETMLANVRLHRDIAAAARDLGLDCTETA